MRDFRYQDLRTGESLQVKRGDAIDPSVMAANRVDMDKMVRTKFIEMGEGSERTPKPVKRKKRGS